MKATHVPKDRVMHLLQTGAQKDSPWPTTELTDQEFSAWFDVDALDFYRQTQAIIKHLDENGQ
jgi:hypothetical protein